MKAIILAGGEGRRMFPFDKGRQKCFLPVGNVPNVVRQVAMLQALGVKDISVITGHEAQWAAHCLRGQDTALVPGGGSLAETLLARTAGSDAVLFLHGDVYLPQSVLAAMAALPQAGAKAAALLRGEEAGFDKQDWIGADAQNGRVRAFFGHPRPHYVNARSGGVFLFTKALYPYLTAAAPLFLNVPAGGMPPAGFWLENCLQAAIEDGHMVEARLAQEPIVDIDFPWELFAANQLCRQNETAQLTAPEVDPTATVHEGVDIKGSRIGAGSVIGPGVVFRGSAVIGQNTVLQNGVIVGAGCLIGDGCVIEDYCKLAENTVIGHRCKVGFTAEVSGVLMDGVAAVHNCELYGIIGRSVDIGAGTSAAFLRFDDGAVTQKVEGKSVTHPLAKAVYIGDNARTGVNCTLLPGARVGGNSCLGPGVVAGGVVPAGTLLLQEQTLQQRPWGPHRYGW